MTTPSIPSSESYPTLTILGRTVLEPRHSVEVFPNPNPSEDLWVTCHTDEFTCHCPVTGQPDFASVTIRYAPQNWIVESKSLKLYLWSFREVGAFHEALSHQIAGELFEALKPQYLEVEMNFNPRGGIGIVALASRGVNPRGGQ